MNKDDQIRELENRIHTLKTVIDECKNKSFKIQLELFNTKKINTSQYRLKQDQANVLNTLVALKKCRLRELYNS